MILVTGSTGLVGGHLLWHLLQENERVTAICRHTSNLDSLFKIFCFYTPTPELYLDRIDWKIADVLDLNALQEAMKDVTEIYHCAAVVSLGNGTNNLLDTNITGTKNMVEAALASHVSKFCFVSSIAACGRSKKNELIDENSTWEDGKSRSAYSRSKYYSEQEVWTGIKKGLNAVIVNPGVILGYSGTKTGSSQLFSQVQKGLKFYTDGGSGYIDVRDVVKAMMLLMKNNVTAERFILVAENCTNKDILSWMAYGFYKPKPKIKMGRKLLLTVGFLSEILGKIFRFNPLIDSGMARSATNREYYSGRKIQERFGFVYSPVEYCILEVCQCFEN
ncbi:MAG TPA: NAD-dependent epimerase/dehydratase family protein [Paludibacter sp.]|nr:NAD-dependent epimerase/dehydratase family protein [Paludibacter sp.]